MTSYTELSVFVRDALARGLSRTQIEDALSRAGWGSDQVESALAEFADIDFPIPVPTPKPYLSAREAFMYLVLFTTLYVSAINLGNLIFQFINRIFPDPSVSLAGFGGYTRDAIRWSVSSIIVAFPIFLYVSHASKVRKWLTYITLFIAAGVIIGDLTIVVFNFLGGELTTRFLLKGLTVGTIAGAIFGYYLWDLRQDESETLA
jgi:hypothetical protein